MTNNTEFTWAPLIPLIGGFPISTEQAFKKPPEAIYSFPGLGNDLVYENYQNNIHHKNLEFKTYKEAILKLIREKEFIGVPFSPAEIINAYNEISGKSLEIDRIIDILKLDVIKYGPNKPAYSEEIEAALLSIGGWDVFCNIENGDYSYIKAELGKQNIKDNPIRLESKRALLS